MIKKLKLFCLKATQYEIQTALWNTNKILLSHLAGCFSESVKKGKFVLGNTNEKLLSHLVLAIGDRVWVNVLKKENLWWLLTLRYNFPTRKQIIWQIWDKNIQQKPAIQLYIQCRRYIRNKFWISCHPPVHHHSVFNGIVS